MAKIDTTPFDAADYLETAEDIAAFMEDALASGDTDEILHALGTVARSRGMTEIARRTGLNRESLYRALREGGNPELGTFLRVMRAVGLRITAAPNHTHAAEPSKEDIAFRP